MSIYSRDVEVLFGLCPDEIVNTRTLLSRQQALSAWEAQAQVERVAKEHAQAMERVERIAKERAQTQLATVQVQLAAALKENDKILLKLHQLEAEKEALAHPPPYPPAYYE